MTKLEFNPGQRKKHIQSMGDPKSGIAMLPTLHVLHNLEKSKQKSLKHEWEPSPKRPYNDHRW